MWLPAQDLWCSRHAPRGVSTQTRIGIARAEGTSSYESAYRYKFKVASRHSFRMLKLGAAAVLALATLGGADAQQCGKTVLSNNFNRYSGSYQPWSEAEAAVDFSSSGQRPGFNGDPVDTGLVFKATTAFTRLSASSRLVLFILNLLLLCRRVVLSLLSVHNRNAMLGESSSTSNSRDKLTNGTLMHWFCTSGMQCPNVTAFSKFLYTCSWWHTHPAEGWQGGGQPGLCWGWQPACDNA